jgi:hypothetical protein
MWEPPGFHCHYREHGASDALTVVVWVDLQQMEMPALVDAQYIGAWVEGFRNVQSTMVALHKAEECVRADSQCIDA